MDLREHKCYIQPIPKHEHSPKRKTKAKLKKDLKINSEASVYAEPPIFVYVDYEAMFSEDGTHLPICICAQTSENDTSYTFYGDDCSKKFLEFLTNLTADQYKVPREVICIFHDLKGYDSIFQDKSYWLTVVQIPAANSVLVTEQIKSMDRLSVHV